MKLHWATNYYGVGNSFGYATHDSKAREACERLGVEIDESAPVAMHVTPPHMFKPVEGKKNVAFCAWEAVQLPECFEVLKGCDALCVTASFLIEPFRRLLGRTNQSSTYR